MTYEDHLYHGERERQCRLLADNASDPDIRRRHSELAELHAGRAASYVAVPIAQLAGMQATAQ